MQLITLGSKRVKLMAQLSGGGCRSKLSGVISRGGGNHGKPATDHHPAPITRTVSGELQYLSLEEVGGSIAEHASDASDIA